MASESSFGSHNPFRRKSNTTVNTDAGPPATSSPTSATTTSSDPTAPSPSHHHLPSSSDFARALSSLPKTDAPPPPVSFAKKKPVKKVRVQSPPPSSPESTGAEHTYPKYPLPARDPDEESSGASASDEEVNGEREDPFQNEAPPLPEEALAGWTGSSMHGLQSGIGIASPSQPPLPQLYTGRGPPPNPFQKTLEDIEREAKEGGQGSAEQAAGAGKAGMDVEAFKRLLLTGQGPTPSQAGDGGSITESSSVSRQSIFESSHPPQETPRTSHEISEPEPEAEEEKRDLISTPQPRGSRSRKKPPPPPATRHGKLIKMELKNKDQTVALESSSPGAGFSAVSPTSPPRPSSTSPTDFNKPLPPPPERADDDAKNNIFEKEAAGKVPELDIDPEADVVPAPRPPTPPNMSHSSSTPVQNPTSTLRKPAPPPRRQGHARSESNIPEDPATTPPRSSLESQRSRSSSIRLNIAAPTPPPPRRQAGGGHTRQSPSVSSPVSNNNQSSPSFPFPAGPTSPGSDEASTAKLSPPPPPPQRNTSIRKSASSPSTRPLSKGFSGSGPAAVAAAAAAAAPPPPPPRTRGSSKGSIDGPGGLLRTRSVDSVRRGDGGVTPVSEEVEAESNVEGGVDDDDTTAGGTSDEAVRAMLADLDALQREVDAARAAVGGGEGG